MGRGRKGTGVELRPNSIRVSFTWNGERCRETLDDTTPTVPNRKAAERMMATINGLIELGRFTLDEYTKHFPNSARAKAAAATDAGEQTFGTFCDTYITSRSELAPATRSQYRNELKRWKARIGASRPMTGILHSWLAKEVGKVEFPSARMRNNSLIPLRGVFELWVADDRARRSNPMDGIDNETVQRDPPDPYEREEVDIITADMLKAYGVLVWAYFEIAFFAGLRPEEEIAFRWSKVDWRRCRGLVDIVRTFKGKERAVKTKRARWVNFNRRVMAALHALRALTQLKKHGHVLENPRTGKPWHDDRSQRDHYWYPTLQRLKLGPRPPYQTRATRATMMLMADMNPAYCAKQLGHSKRVFFETYADWIELAQRHNDRERAKDEADVATRDEAKAVG